VARPLPGEPYYPTHVAARESEKEERMTTQQTQQQRIKVPSQALPSDGLSRFVRMGAWAAMVSGLALVVSFLMEWLVVPHERLGSDAFLTSAYTVSSGLRLLSLVLLLWALIGIYGPQSRAAGTFGLWAFVVVFLGTALSMGNTWAEVFVWPTFAQVAPGMVPGGFTTEAASYMARGLTLSFPLFGLGLILFGAATFWARVYPRWIAVLLIVSVPVTMFLDPTAGTLQESIGQILLGIAVAALGFYAFLRRAASSTSS
jgi:hypothetical protein